MMDKQSIRRAVRERREALPARERASASRAVCRLLCAWDVYRRAKTVLAYAAVRGELDLTDVMEDALSSGKTLLLPRCEADGVMTARRVLSLGGLQKSAYGIPEPGEDAPILAPEDVDLALVPGIAFSPAGARVGQGGGYYDRYLPRLGGVSAGVGYGFQLMDELPALLHDAPVEYVVHPGGIVRCRRDNER